MKTKTALREYYKNLRKTLDIQKISDMAVSRLINLDVYKNASTIFTYSSFGDEVNTAAVIADKSKCICIPKIADGMIIMSEINQGKLIKNKYGISEPLIVKEKIPCKNDIIIVPALAADRHGYRLGYGGGYYDRFLKNIDTFNIILLPAECISSQIPHELHDIRCHAIVTESEVIYTD